MFAQPFHINPARATQMKRKGTKQMSMIDEAVAALSAKLADGFDGSAKFVIEGAGALIVDGGGVRAADDGEEADVTMTASADTFQGILTGNVNPAMAFMSGKLKLEGDMGTAMRLGSALG
jgi:putative sterol carrier protein